MRRDYSQNGSSDFCKTAYIFLEYMEPICAEVFPWNSIDASSYPAFIRDNDIQKGIIVADKVRMLKKLLLRRLLTLRMQRKKGLSPRKVTRRRKKYSVSLFSSQTRIWNPKLHTCAMRTDGSWNWYLTGTKVMNVWITPMCGAISL